MAHLEESDGRIQLVAVDHDLLDAEEASAAALAGALGVREPDAWPPMHTGDRFRSWVRKQLADPAQRGWLNWYVIADGTLVGSAGYKGAPDPGGIVEIGYSIVEPMRRRGLATAAVKLLAERAFRDPQVTLVAAETLPSLPASIGVLRNCGFALLSERVDPDAGPVLRFGLNR